MNVTTFKITSKAASAVTKQKEALFLPNLKLNVKDRKLHGLDGDMNL